MLLVTLSQRGLKDVELVVVELSQHLLVVRQSGRVRQDLVDVRRVADILHKTGFVQN